MRPSGAVSLTVPVLGSSLNMLVSITLLDLISPLYFPVQLHSISPTVENGDSYIKLLKTQQQRMQRNEWTENESGREKDKRREKGKESAKEFVLRVFIHKS